MTREAAVSRQEKLTWSQEELNALSTEELFQPYKRTGSEELKWPLVMRYTGLVKTIALQVRGVYSSFAQVDDIVNEGLLTLAGAVDKFDPDKGIPSTPFFTVLLSLLYRLLSLSLARYSLIAPTFLEMDILLSLSTTIRLLRQRILFMPS